MPDSANEHLVVLEELMRSRMPASILDVGMGRGSYGWWLRNKVGYTGRLVGLEIWAPYVVGPEALAGGNRTYYDQIVVADVRESEKAMVEIAPDVVFAFDIIEHLVREQGAAVVRSLQRAARHRVLVSLPVVPYPQGPYLGNPHEEHKCDWTVPEMRELGGVLVGLGAITGLFAFPAAP